MNHTRVGEEFGDMALKQTWKVFSVLLLRNILQGNITTTPYKLHYSRKPSMHKFHVLFCQCVYKVVLFCQCVYKVYQCSHRESSSSQRSFDLY
jgi:hypothetical protein